MTSQGLQTIQISAGAFTRQSDGSPVQQFSDTFRYAALQLQVASTTPAAGGVFTLPTPLTYDVTFNTPVLPSSVGTSSLTLAGISGADVTAATVLSGNATVQFTLGGILAAGSLTASIAAGAITDAYGNPCAAFLAGYSVQDMAVDHYTFSTIASPQIQSVPFTVTIDACDPSGNLLTAYYGTRPLTALGQGGALSVYPSSVTFSAGVWTGSVTVEASDPGAVLQLTNAAGGVSSSNSFVVNPSNVSLSGPWDTFGNGPSHTGYFPGLLSGDPQAVLRWSASLDSNQVAVDDGCVYATTYQGVEALSESTGAQLWQDPFTSVSSVNPATYNGGQVYVQTITGNEVGQLWSFNAASGATTWFEPLRLPVGPILCTDHRQRQHLG